jgi:hypothetical protein
VGFADLDRSTRGCALPFDCAQGSGLRPLAKNDDKLEARRSCAAQLLERCDPLPIMRRPRVTRVK